MESKDSSPISFRMTEALGKIQEYIVVKQIGSVEEHMYPVFLAYNLESNFRKKKLQMVVIKAIDVEDPYNSFNNEVAISELESNPRIVKCISKILDFELQFGEFKGIRYNLLVFPFIPNGDFFDVVMKYPLDESTARFCLEQLIDAVDFLHKKGFVHRDIKLENILVDEDYNLILADFGHAAEHSDLNGSIKFTSETTKDLIPPEFYKSKQYEGISMDMFTIGRLLFQMVTALNPFEQATNQDTKFWYVIMGDWESYWMRIESQLEKKKRKVKTLSYEFKRLIWGLLNPNPDLRFSIQQIRESEWFVNTKPTTLKEFVEKSSVQSFKA